MANEPAQSTESKVETNQPGVSPTSVDGQGQPATPSSQTGEQASSTQTTPFDIENHPKWKGMIRENRRWKSELETMRREVDELRGFRDGLGRQRENGQNAQQANQLTQEEEMALETLMNKLSYSPRALKILSEKLGVNELGDIKNQIGELSNSWYSSQADSEMEAIRKYASDNGLEPDDVEDEVRNGITTDPIYSQVGYRRGAFKAVFNNLYFDKRDEIRERAENKKKIDEREKLKRGQTQGSSASQTRPGLKETNADKAFLDTVRNAGGVSGIDFTR